MDFVDAVNGLKRLQYDSEKKLIQFDEIVPFEHNVPKIYSPILVNLMLEVGPQIEDITNLIISELDLSDEGGVTSRIREINKNEVLSSFEIFCFLPNKLLLDPFEQKREWWNIYNRTKHELSQSQFDIKYNSVVDALGSLAALHRLADVLVKIIESLDTNSEQEYKKYLLKKESWRKITLGPNSIAAGWMVWDNTGMSGGPNVWRSKLFEIPDYFIYESNLVLKSFREKDSESQKPV